MSNATIEGASEGRAGWNARHCGALPSPPEPSLAEMFELLPRGLALDVACGTGRHGIFLARSGFKVVAVDYAETGLRTLQSIVRAERLDIWPLAADITTFPLPQGRFDTILNISFLHRPLLPRLIDALRPGGALLFDTFLVDQAEAGHPRNPDFLLEHYELREKLRGMDLARYREGIVSYQDGKSAWRATALATRKRM
jgi:tellurite methyltransferase